MLALPFLPSPVRDTSGSGVLPRIGQSLKDLWLTVRQRRGLLALILCFLPLGIGASSGLWSAVAKDWDAGPNLVAIVTGVVGGLVSAAGCILGGFICDRWDRQKCYVWFGIFVSLAGVALAILPRTPLMFTLGTLAFSFWTGVAWAGYTAFVLEAIGKGAAATKFSAFASLANAPIAYMTYFVGWVQENKDTTTMLYYEALTGLLGAGIFILAVKWLLPSRDASQTPLSPALPPPGTVPAAPLPHDPFPVRPAAQSVSPETDA
jgi:predicted MFS family arabinose efflux permease